MPPSWLARLSALAVLGLGLAGCAGQTSDAPVGLVEPHSITLTWHASTSPVRGYRIYRATSAAARPVVLAVTPANTTQYTDTTVETGKTYFYAVAAFNAADQESVLSNSVSASIPTQ